MNKRIVIIGLLLIVLAIILGAFGAHALKEVLASDKLASFETGVRYQMYIGLLLLVLGLNFEKFNSSIKLPLILIIIGIFIFSGSIYLLSIQEYLEVNFNFLGPITPIGGSSMIVGCFWIIKNLLTPSQS